MTITNIAKLSQKPIILKAQRVNSQIHHSISERKVKLWNIAYQEDITRL